MLELPGYQIEKQIGKGGMAKVYLALHEGLHRQVAIKVMAKHLDEDDSGFSDRFMREARIVANLGHQNIVTVYDVGKHDGYHYIAMEYLPGGITLDHKIQEGFDVQKGLVTIQQIASALAYAHDKGIVHRDVKPENIMFREDGSAVLTDFGIARSTTSATKMTATGTVIGTPHYMSPEQAQGHEIGGYSDIYSLGVVFYEMLVGKVPYDADSTIAVVFKHITEPVPEFEGDIKQYQPILNNMMAKDKADRYQSCQEIIADLDKVIQGVTPASKATMVNTAINPAVTPAQLNKKQSQSKNKKLPVAIAASITAITIVAGTYFYYQHQQTQQLAVEQAQQQKYADQQKQAELKSKARPVEQQAEQENVSTEDASLRRENTAAEQNAEQQAQQKAEQQRLALLQADKAKKAAAKARAAKERQQGINKLLQQAENDLFNTKLNKAYKKYTAVQKIEPGNRFAKNGIKRIADQYLALANNEAIKGNFEKANQYIAAVIKITPTHKNLAATQQKVFELKNQQLTAQATREAQQKAEQQNKPAEEKQTRRSFGGF